MPPSTAEKVKAGVLWLLLINKRWEEPQPPLLRGKIHLVLLYMSPFWLAALFRSCTSVRSWVSCCVAAFVALFNFSMSALLHNKYWLDDAHRQRMRKLDYSGIFLMITGSALPVLVCGAESKVVVGVVVIGELFLATAGVYLTLSGSMYALGTLSRALVFITTGLAHVMCVAYYYSQEYINRQELTYLVLMAMCYIAGGLCYGLKWPVLWPKVFGFHELFHLCCAVGAGLTLMADDSAIRRLAAS